jgi:hypothetical protein
LQLASGTWFFLIGFVFALFFQVASRRNSSVSAATGEGGWFYSKNQQKNPPQ